MQLFLAYGGVTKGKPIFKQWIPMWQVETIKCVYAAHDLETPCGIRGHQTQKQAISMAEMAGVDPKCICQATMWASSSTFAHYYMFSLLAKAHSDFDRRVLRMDGSSHRVSRTGTLLGYHILKKKS